MENYDKDFSCCYQKFARPLTNFIGKKIGDWDSAEEIVQEIFTYLYSKKEPLNIDSRSIVSFMFRVARHKVIDYMKKNGNHTLPGLITDSLPDHSEMTKVESAVINKELAGEIKYIIKQTPDPLKEIIVRTYTYGHKMKKISRDLSVSEYKVAKTLKEFSLVVRERLGPLYNV